MATAADFEKAWRLGYLNKDYSLIKTMLHPDYRCFDYRMGLEIDFEAEKSLMETISPFLTLGPWKLLYEMMKSMLSRCFPDIMNHNQDT